jgi:hypothetical protein
MAAAADLRINGGEFLSTRHRTTGLPHGFGQRDKIVDAVRRRVELALMADKIPTPRRGQAPSVLFA